MGDETRELSGTGESAEGTGRVREQQPIPARCTSLSDRLPFYTKSGRPDPLSSDLAWWKHVSFGQRLETRADAVGGVGVVLLAWQRSYFNDDARWTRARTGEGFLL